MKKHLIAAAVAAAVAVPAMAQNVTLYGVIDGGYTDFQAKVAGKKTTTRGVTESANSSSRWGLRGTEDLGGGLKANFQIESSIGTGSNAGDYALPSSVRTQTRAGINTQTDNGGAWVNTANIGNRAMWVGVSTSQGTEVRIGQQDTPIRTIALEYNADGTTNVVGNLLAGNSGAFADRANAISLTQKLGDVTGAVALMSKSTKTDAATKEEGGDGYALLLRYAAGPLSVGLAHASTEVSKNAVDNVQVCYSPLTGLLTGATSCTAPVTATFVGTADTPAYSVKNERTVIGGNYDFGVARVSLAYGKQQVTDKAASPNTEGENKVWSVGARVPLGATTLFATYSDGDQQATAADRKNDQSGMVLGATYAMSKRTSLYAIYGSAEYETGATSETKYRQISAGMVHSF